MVVVWCDTVCTIRFMSNLRIRFSLVAIGTFIVGGVTGFLACSAIERREMIAAATVDIYQTGESLRAGNLVTAMTHAHSVV